MFGMRFFPVILFRTDKITGLFSSYRKVCLPRSGECAVAHSLKRRIVTPLFSLKPEPVKIKFAARHENKIHAPLPGKAVNRERQLLIAAALREFRHVVDL